MKKADRLEITVTEDPVTGVWTFELSGHQVEVEPRHGFVKIDGRLHQVSALEGLQDVEDLAGTPLTAIRRLLPRPASEEDGEPPRVEPSTRSKKRAGSRSRPAEDEEPRDKTQPAPKARQAAPSPTKTDKTQQTTPDPEAALHTQAAAAYLGLSPATLETMRSRGGGPHFVKLGRRVVYRRADLDEWLADSVRRSTSDPGKRAKN